MENSSQASPANPALTNPAKLATALPPHVWFGISAVFHYLGPAFAVLLFAHVGVLGMAWLRIATAALVFVACAAGYIPAWRASRLDPTVALRYE